MCQIMLGNASLLCNNIVYDFFFNFVGTCTKYTITEMFCFLLFSLTLYFFKQDRSFLNKDISFLERLSFTLKKKCWLMENQIG